MSHLGDYLRQRRVDLGQTLGQLARLVGYRNVNKGVRRLTVLERTGNCMEDLLVRVIEALGIDLAAVERLMDEDYQDRLRAWEKWVNEPVPMELIVRLMAAVYARKRLPADITTHDQAEAWACDFAREHQRKVCLVLSRRHSVWIDEQGEVYARTEATPEQSNVPWMEVGGRRFLLERPLQTFASGNSTQKRRG